jgi:signal transduction histidine kinase
MNDIRVTRIVFAVNLSVVAGAVFGLTTAFLHLRYRLSVELAERNRQIAESQQALVQSEKMAALGRLSAGMAHELNNPASAAERGVSHLADAVERLRLASYELGRAGLEPSLLDRLRSIDDRAQRLARAPRTINAADRMDRETEIQDWLADRTPTLATDCGALVDLDFTTDALDDLLTAFGTATFPLVVERAVTWHTINVLLDDIGGGAKRVVDIVKALKSYTHLDQSPTQLVDIHEGLDDTLVMLNSLLREGITVRREYDRSIPRLTVHGGELNQVWTNIIENAAQAMEGGGDIVVRTFSDDHFAVVQIIDSGPGIPAHVADRVFDPFVTTKPVGQGTGLGLNICRNIVVEKHGGSIDVDSAPGRTCFEVRLPLST